MTKCILNYKTVKQFALCSTRHDKNYKRQKLNIILSKTVYYIFFPKCPIIKFKYYFSHSFLLDILKYWV